jgi:hypothetical protein
MAIFFLVEFSNGLFFVNYFIFLKLILLFVSRFFNLLFFSKSKKELISIAFFGQEKIQQCFKMLSTSIRAIGSGHDFSCSFI